MTARFAVLLVAIMLPAAVSIEAQEPTTGSRGRSSPHGLSSLMRSDPVPMPLFQGLFGNLAMSRSLLILGRGGSGCSGFMLRRADCPDRAPVRGG